ncbi:DUF1643 domain-containing protein [Leucobacter chromiiresistens]|uniref:DUF1643 domain-containing protein n=1 Tax=Leucobacter chromiiresistens TaxID=1079994 RepID=A0A1H1A0K4_9MICO|nr:DUF1643 domain-containing protein [Leucobacter chromiiresistens]SDQ33247.1 hypothetical protein SAMN04488565_2235 [Leucobacter chromiiresistens]
MTEFITATADIRGDYRYSLTRVWDETLPKLTYILLNPSTADATKLDNTLKQCVKISKFNGFGGLLILNLYAYRATEPKVMKAAADPIGPENDQFLAAATGTIVGGWGNNADFARANFVRSMHPNMKALKINGTGHPKHPLYVSETTRLIDWLPRP